MEQVSRLSFSLQPFESALAIIPIIDAIPLTELILSFEGAKGYEPAGGYGGLIPKRFNYGALDRYFLGDFVNEGYFGRRGHIYVLGCSCGEVECWPLKARVRAEADTFVWDSFQQPHRPERDYSRFGPFIFHGVDYRQAVAGLQAALSAGGSISAREAD